MKPVVKRNWFGSMPPNMLGTGVLLLALCGAAAPAHAQPLVNYMKSNTGAPLCLAVMNGRIANDSPLITWDCISGDPSQLFYLRNNMFHIGSQTGNFCLASYDNPAHAGSRVGVWQCQTGDPTQQFNRGANADIEGPHGLCIGVTTGSNVRGAAVGLVNCMNYASIALPNQAWQAGLVTAAAPAPAPVLPQLAISSAPQATFFYSGRPLRANPLSNGYLISQDGASIVAAHVDQNWLLVGSDGKPLYITSNFLSHNGSALVASGGGNLVASGGGNLVASGGGNLQPLATIGGMSLYDQFALSTALQQKISAAALATSRQLAQKAVLSGQPQKTISVISPNGSSIATNNGANIATNNGGNFHTLSVPATPPQPPARLQLTIAGPITFANNVENTISWQYAGTPAAGQSTVYIYLVVNGGSRYQLAANVKLTDRRAVVARANWTSTFKPQSNCTVVIWDANGTELAQVRVTLR